MRLSILSSAIRAGGSTLGDNQYVDLFGSGGSYQEAHRVYGRGANGGWRLLAGGEDRLLGRICMESDILATDVALPDGLDTTVGTGGAPRGRGL